MVVTGLQSESFDTLDELLGFRVETGLQCESFDTLDDLLGFRVQKLWSKVIKIFY